MKPKLTPKDRSDLAAWTAAAWRAQSDRGFAEGCRVREIVLRMADIIRRLEGK